MMVSKKSGSEAVLLIVYRVNEENLSLCMIYLIVQPLVFEVCMSPDDRLEAKAPLPQRLKVTNQYSDRTHNMLASTLGYPLFQHQYSYTSSVCLSLNLADDVVRYSKPMRLIVQAVCSVVCVLQTCAILC